jgi:hypothetical protein
VPAALTLIASDGPPPTARVVVTAPAQPTVASARAAANNGTHAARQFLELG